MSGNHARISNNYINGGSGGGVYVGDGLFIMSGENTTICDNYTDSYGGGIYLSTKAVFNMSGANATINGNKSLLQGGGICMYDATATFTMTGGTVYGNSGTAELPGNYGIVLPHTLKGSVRFPNGGHVGISTISPGGTRSELNDTISVP
jgi:hypothetical protein